MSPPVAPIAVVIPARNSRHLLGRSLAGIAAQTHVPAQILIVDQESADGLADWLQIRWPGVELLTVPLGTRLADILQSVSAPTIAFLQPGDHWPRDRLEALAGLATLNKTTVPAEAATSSAGLSFASPNSTARATLRQLIIRRG